MYAYEWHDPNMRYAYGYPVGAAIAKGRITSMDVSTAKKAPGVLAVVTTLDVGERKKGKFNTAKLFGGDEVQHYHQTVAVVVAESFEQARAAAALVKVDYAEEKGAYDLGRQRITPSSRTNRSSPILRSAISMLPSSQRPSLWTRPTRRPTNPIP